MAAEPRKLYHIRLTRPLAVAIDRYQRFCGGDLQDRAVLQMLLIKGLHAEGFWTDEGLPAAPLPPGLTKPKKK